MTPAPDNQMHPYGKPNYMKIYVNNSCQNDFIIVKTVEV